jgi:hypothetical protein
VAAITAPPSARGRPPSLRTAHPAPTAATNTTTIVSSSGSTPIGRPSRASGMWCAASHSGIADPNAPSSDIPPPAVSTTAAAEGISIA